MIVASVLGPIEDALAWLLEHLHDTVGLSWGWSIVALTIIVRVLLVPVMVRQIHSMQRLQAHAPEMKALQQRYKGDRARLNEEMMKFYKENEINPAASCLPLVFQIPVFFALYFVLRNFAKHTDAPASQLGWLHIVPNITDKITAHWSGWVLLVVYVVSQVAYGYFGTLPTMPRSQRILFMVLPVFFVPVITHFPVGLLMYWMTTNLWTVGQGVVTRQLRMQTEEPMKRSSRTAPKEEPPDAGDGARRGDASPDQPPPAAKQRTGPRQVKRKKKKARR